MIFQSGRRISKFASGQQADHSDHLTLFATDTSSTEIGAEEGENRAEVSNWRPINIVSAPAGGFMDSGAAWAWPVSMGAAKTKPSAGP